MKAIILITFQWSEELEQLCWSKRYQNETKTACLHVRFLIQLCFMFLEIIRWLFGSWWRGKSARAAGVDGQTEQRAATDEGACRLPEQQSERAWGGSGHSPQRSHQIRGHEHSPPEGLTRGDARVQIHIIVTSSVWLSDLQKFECVSPSLQS